MFRDQSKNFFYDIRVSTQDGKKSVRLTDTILKLCTKVDIIEAIASEEGDGASSLAMSFIEADFLPDDLDKTPAEGISGRGYITNRTGALLDLRFDTEKGFTYVTPQELQSGYTQSSRTKSGVSEEVKFVFSPNNMIEVTWGNLEPRTSRTKTFKIGTVNYAAGSGGNTLNLQCFDLQKELARVKVNEGVAWLDGEGNPLSLKQALHSIARVFGARLDFDEAQVTAAEMSGYTPPADYILDRTSTGGDTRVSTNGKPLYLLRSQSIDFWLKDLAKSFNSVYEIFEDPALPGTPVIKFTSRVLRYKKVIKSLNYRDPNEVMLDFQFNTIAGEVSKESSASAVDENGKAEAEYKTVQLTDGRSQTTPPNTFEGIPLVYNTRAREILQRYLVGASITTPTTTESSVTSSAERQTYNSSFMGFITVKTVGHPDFKPDVMQINGVGVRASNTYRFFQVEHSLSSEGYVCTMQGKTQEVVEQGPSNIDQLKENEEYRVTELVRVDNQGQQ